jgi:hypothetical protein
MSKLRNFNKKLIKEDVAPNSDIINAINKAVDLWVNDLKRELISGSSSQRSLWDRFKNTLANLWHGRENEKNPYVWTNKLGGLGQTVESIRHYKFSLNEYKYFQEICENLEQTINEEDLPANISKLRIMNIIDKQANNLKNKLADIFKIGIESGKFKIDQMPQPSPETTPQKPTGSPQKPTESPEATPQKPTGSPQKPTGSPQKPTGSPQKPTGSPQKLTGSPEATPQKPAGSPQKPTESLEQKRLKGPPEQQRLKGSPEQKPDTDQDKFSHNNPPTVDKKWTDLEKDEKDAWNTYSGGVTSRSLRSGHPMELPRIVRLGDPRRSILKTPLANQIVSTFDDLLRKGRVETIENPIKSRKELIERIAQVFGERRRTVSEEIPEIPQKPTGEKTSPEAPQKSTGEKTSPETPQKPTGEKTSPETSQKPTASPEQKLTAPGRSGLKGSPEQKPENPNAETEEQRKEREKKNAEEEAKDVNAYLKHLLSLIKEFEDKEAYSKLFEYYNEISKQLKDILANKNRPISDEQRETRYLHKIFTTIQGLLQEEISKITDPKRREEAEQLWTEIDMMGNSDSKDQPYSKFNDGVYYHRYNTWHGKSAIIDYHNFVSHILYNTPYERNKLNVSDKDRDIDDKLYDPRKQDGKNKK